MGFLRPSDLAEGVSLPSPPHREDDGLVLGSAVGVGSRFLDTVHVLPKFEYSSCLVMTIYVFIYLFRLWFLISQ